MSDGENSNSESIKDLLQKRNGLLFKQRRIKLSLNQDAMAEALSYAGYNVDRRTVLRWENAQTPVPAWALDFQNELLKHRTKSNDSKVSGDTTLGVGAFINSSFLGELRDKLRSLLKG